MMPDPQTVEVKTEDGLTLRCRRYPRPGARPVVLGHGLASSGYTFDLPLSHFRISERIYHLGYEVWIMNFRGAGHIPWRSEGGDWRHSGDHWGAFDLPAVIRRAVEGAGKPAFYLGHSFGGMALYLYLQGGVIDGSGQTVNDAAAARERNQLVAGAVTAGSAVTMPEGPVQSFQERLRVLPPVQRAFARVEQWLFRRERLAPRLPVGYMSLLFGFRHPMLTRLVMSSPMMAAYMVPSNMGTEACRLFGTWGAGDVSLRQVIQTIQVVRRADLASLLEPDMVEPAYRYGEYMANITTPLVAAGGGRDFMQPRYLDEGVLAAISSESKRLVELPRNGHVDMLYWLPYADIFGWLEEHARS